MLDKQGIVHCEHLTALYLFKSLLFQRDKPVKKPQSYYVKALDAYVEIGSDSRAAAGESMLPVGYAAVDVNSRKLFRLTFGSFGKFGHYLTRSKHILADNTVGKGYRFAEKSFKFVFVMLRPCLKILVYRRVACLKEQGMFLHYPPEKQVQL